jgi:hypothetical protein
MTNESRNALIKDKAVEVGEIDGLEYWIVPSPIEDALNGYVVFPKKPVREDGYHGILTYVPVHGGITYCEHDRIGSVYGFDTLHCDSDKFLRTDPRWIKRQIEVMIKGIRKAAEVEAKYLRCVSNRGKGKYAQMVFDTLEGDKEMNFGMMLNILAGRL